MTAVVSCANLLYVIVFLLTLLIYKCTMPSELKQKGALYRPLLQKTHYVLFTSWINFVFTTLAKLSIKQERTNQHY